MNPRTFLFGIGAAKAGTSWLYNYLFDHPDCHFKALKEIHYFNTLHGNGTDWPRMSRQRRLSAIEQTLNNSSAIKDNTRLLQQRADIETWNGLFDGKTENDAGYVDFLTHGGENAALIGDITPAYATLGEDGFRHMVKIGATIGARCRFIMLLRDPLSRMWSNVRMTAQRRAQRLGDNAEHSATQQVEAFIRGDNDGLRRRSEYRRTIGRLLNAVPRKNVLFAFFEQLFTSHTLRRITDFLHIRTREGATDKIYNRGRAMPMPDDLRRRALMALAPQYEFISAMFGNNMPAEWQENHEQLVMAGY